jgi:hypothetical protein
MVEVNELNYAKDLLTAPDLVVYKLLGYPSNVFILEKALKARLKNEPGYEVWVPFHYYRYLPANVKGDRVFLKTEQVLVSNRGNVISLIRNGPRLASKWIQGGYYTSSFKDLDKQERFLIHRALACLFIAKPDEFFRESYANLQVNHIDGDKLNIELSNLEWVTCSGNVVHALETGLTVKRLGLNHHGSKPVKVTIGPGMFYGREFILIGQKEMKDNGFNYTPVGYCCLGKSKTYRGCKFSFATEAEIRYLSRGLPPEVMAAIPPSRKEKKRELAHSL